MDEGQQQMLEVQKMIWGLGEYSFIAEVLRPVAKELVRACEVSSGHRLLDVGAGTGNVAIEAVAAGASAVATDLAPSMVERGKARTREMGLEIEWQEADAQNLPFEDGSFDAAASAMGAMFAPDADAAVAEMTRVVKPGGRIALAAWTADGYTGKSLQITSKYVPPPPEGVNTSGEWGDESTARSRFEKRLEDVKLARSSVTWAFATREEARSFWLNTAPPMLAAKMALPPERFEEMAAELEALQDASNTATDGGVSIESEFLLVVGRKSPAS